MCFSIFYSMKTKEQTHLSCKCIFQQFRKLERGVILHLLRCKMCWKRRCGQRWTVYGLFSCGCVVHADVPIPSLFECSSSMRGADAPSASMSSADCLSRASSHRTPADTRFTFSTYEYRSCGTQTNVRTRESEGGGAENWREDKKNNPN